MTDYHAYPNIAEDDFAALHGDLDAEQRQAERRMLLACKTCGSEITGEGIGSRASFLSRMMRRSGLCLRCFGVRRTA